MSCYLRNLSSVIEVRLHSALLRSSANWQSRKVDFEEFDRNNLGKDMAIRHRVSEFNVAHTEANEPLVNETQRGSTTT